MSKSITRAGLPLLIAVSTSISGAIAQEVTRAVSPAPILSSTVAAAPGNQMTVYLTGYSFWDNTPAGSTAIAKPMVHRRAGGSGTYNDPITLAVGHSLNGRRQTMDYPAGTRFYFPRLRKYAVVEDVCGDGASPQTTGCHRGYRGYTWLDIYVDGKRSGESAADACMNRITGVQTAIINPAKDLPVEIGAITEAGCQIF